LQPWLAVIIFAMKVLNTYNFISFINYAVFVPVVTILVCYVTAVLKGDVPGWFLPMVSACGVVAPEKWIFHIGLIVSSVLIHSASKVVRDFISSNNPDSTTSKWEDTAVLLNFIACGGLAGCASITEKEDNNLHGLSAIIFFVFYIIYMWIVSLRVSQQIRERPGPSVYYARNSLHYGAGQTARYWIASIVTVDFVVFILFNVFKAPIDPYQAIAEWIGIGGIIMFNITWKKDVTQAGKCDIYTATLFEPQNQTYSGSRFYDEDRSLL
jgi:hypothetical membrane protein